MSKCWTRSSVILCLLCVSASPATLERNRDDPTEDEPQEKTAEQQVARMLDSSVEGISEAGSVAHVLALDALDAVKDVAKTRWNNYLAKQPRQERNLFSRIVSSSIPNDYDDRDGADDGFLTDGESGYILDEELDSDYNWYNTIVGRMLLLFGYSRNDVITSRKLIEDVSYSVAKSVGNTVLWLMHRVVEDTRTDDQLRAGQEELRLKQGAIAANVNAYYDEVEYQREKYGQYNVWPPMHNQYGGGSEEGRMLQEHGLLSTVSNIVKAANADSARVREDLLGADLPAKIISKVKRSSEDGGMDTSCVQLFICRMSPIIWGLQDSAEVMESDSLAHNLKVWSGVVNTFMPNSDDFKRVQPACDETFSKCKLVEFS